jgi:putative membrane-bound dehydrogenase-like protein
MLKRIAIALALAGLMSSSASWADDSASPTYPDHRVLGVWRDAAGEHPVKSPADWAHRRAHILDGIQQAMGKLPDRSKLGPLDVRVSDQFKGPNFTRYTLSFVADEGDRVPCYLFVPEGLGGKRAPGVLALHQTTPTGKGQPAGLADSENLHYALELAKRGYVVLAPDYPSFGDYKYDFNADGYSSGSMKGIFNHMRAVDLLASRDEVDPQRIGAIGHSLGGHNAIFVGVFDERIKVIVSSCGWTPLHDYYGGKLTGWTSDRYVPAIRDVYKLDPDRVPFDLCEMVAALAPRAFFSNSPMHDGNFEVEGVRKAIAEVKPIYDLLGAGERLQVRYPDAGHEFPPSVRHEAYQFMDLVLNHVPRADIRSELARVAPHEPRDAIATFTVQPGFRLDQVAAEPLVASPVAMAHDEDGRLYVVEMRDYSEQDQERLGRIRLLEDTDGDGTFDQAEIFVDDLSWPTAVTCWDGGIFVGAAPDIWFFRDTTGDSKADVRTKVFTGFARNNVQGLLNSFQWGPDNRIHGSASSNGGLITRPDAPDAKGVSVSGRDFSFDPRTLELRAESGGAQHGMTFDDWGRKFVCSNSDHIQMVMFEDRYLARNPNVPAPSARVSIASDGPQAEVFRTSPIEPWRIVRTRLRVTGAAPGPIEGGGRAGGYFTGATGTTIYRGDAWPSEFVGQSFTGDVGSNIVHRKILKPDGIGFIADRADKGREFVASTDNWFRAAQFANGPDGNLYIIDVYREVIEHPLSLPPEIKQYLDLTSGRERGRIYRVAPAGFHATRTPKLSDLPTDELVGRLESSNGWTRDAVTRLLYERQDWGALGPLEKLTSESKSPLARAHALDALAGLDLIKSKALSPATLLARLDDESPRVREHAVRLSEPLLANSPELSAKIRKLAGDDDIRVRYQVAFTLGAMRDPERIKALAAIVRHDAPDRWISLAVTSALAEGAGELFATLAADRGWRATAQGRSALADLASYVGRQNHDAESKRLLTALESLANEDDALAEAVVRGFGAGISKSPGTLAGQLTALGGVRSSRVLGSLLERARRDAADHKLPAAERVEAIQTLALDGYATARPVLTPLLSTHEPQNVQSAALGTLARYTDPRVAQSILEAWPSLGPRMRSQAAEVLFSRPAWLAMFIDAVETEKASLADIDAARRSALESHPNLALRQRAAPLLAKLKNGRRQDVVDAYRPALTAQGDRSRGRQVFQKVCAACHRLEGVGHEIGPSLAAFRNRGAEALLVNVLDPNREVNPQYLNYVLITQDGRSMTGMIAAETANSVTLRRAEDITDTVARSEIEVLRSSNLSIMPEGLEKQIDPAAMADLLAYLAGVL